METAIAVKHLTYRYPDGTQALEDVSFSVPLGARVALLGPNGAGKSTLLLHLNALYRIQEGEIYILGQKLGPGNEAEVRRRVGLVFQDPDDQLFAPTVAEDVAFGPRNLGLPNAEVERRVARALNTVGLEALKDKTTYHLSYGQKKKVALAGVLAMEPEILLLDEPTAYLDPAGQAALMELLARPPGKQTVILTTHDVDLAAEWADYVLILKEGRLLDAGPADQLLRAEDLMAQAQLNLPTVSRLFRQVPGLSPVPLTMAEGIEFLRYLVAGK